MRFFSQTDLTTNSEMDFSTVEWGDNASSNSPANNNFDAGIVVNTDYSVAFSQWTLEPISFGFDEFFVEFNLSSVVVDKPLFVDIPGDLSTTAVLTVGGSVSDTLEVSADQDWFAITLVAGQRYSFALDGSGASPLSDPLVRILDNTGLELQTNDDGGTGLNSLLTYTATYSGTYYISAQAYNDGTNPTSTGDYTLTSAELPPLAERDIDGIANFLTDEFSTRASYNTGGGGTTTINFSFASGANSLSAGAEALARRALDAWSEVANIIFVEGPGDIVFRDNGSGAFNSNTRSGSTILSSDLNISSTWNGGNLNVDSYTYQTFLHEIGHSLGLGHAGPYNGDATYGIDNVYLNDSWAYTIMSYFDQNDGAYFGDFRFVLGPQIADIIALEDLYGANTTTRSGDTTYGYNSTETDVHDFSQFTRAPSLSILDTGGIDTLDFSGYSADARIDLNAEAFSDVDGIRGVISIARNTVIENAIGGTGNDDITGNSADNVLTGGVGDDVLDGGAGTDYAAFSGVAADYTIVDNGGGTWTVSHNGGGADGSDTLSNIEFARFSDGDVALVAASPFSENADNFTGNATGETLDALGGDDVVNGAGGDDVINGGNGADTLNGDAGNDTLSGDAGNDTLNGGAGDDVLSGGDNDDFLVGGTGADVLNGGNGTDTVSYALASSAVTLSLVSGGTLGDAAGDSYISIERVLGSNYNDTISGSGLADTLFGRAGADNISGGLGNDLIYGNLGDDALNGNGGDDQLWGGSGADHILGGAGDDTMYGEDGNDLINSGAGNDTVNGGNGSDRVFGLAGNDMLNGDAGDDQLFGGDGDDTLIGGAGADLLNGGVGTDTVSYLLAVTAIALNLNSGGTLGDATGDNYISIEQVFGSNFNDSITGSSTGDVLYGEGGVDTILGGSGNDFVYGGIGDDVLKGNSGDDQIWGGSGADHILGGDGDDIMYGEDGDDLINSGAGSDTIDGGTGNDRLFGLDGNDTLIGGIGDDILNGGNNNDILFGGAGADILNGGAGTDTASYALATNAVTLSLTSGGTAGDAAGDSYISIERVLGSNYDDTIFGSSATDRLYGRTGADTLSGGAGNDFLYGNLGDDVLRGNTGNDQIWGGAGLDNILGGDGDDILHGEDGDDLLNGGAGADIIDGGSGNDRLFGLDGNDRLTGGAGNDSMTGGGQLDTFVFDFTGVGTDLDTIQDFAVGVDTIEINGGFVFADLDIIQSGVNVLVRLNGHRILVRNTTVADMDAAQFDFPPLGEAPDGDKSPATEDFTVVDDAVVADALIVSDKLVVSESDGFVFTDKAAVADDSVFGLDDLSAAKDAFAQYIAQAELAGDTYISSAEAAELGVDFGDSLFDGLFDFG